MLFSKRIPRTAKSYSLFSKRLQVFLVAIAILALFFLCAKANAHVDTIDPSLGIEVDKIMRDKQRESDLECFERVLQGSTEPKDLEGFYRGCDRDMT